MDFRAANHFDFPEIIELLEELNLDMEDIEPEQFVVAVVDDVVVGIGRVVCFEKSAELSSLGVQVEHRGKGIGKGIVNLLLERHDNTKLFVVTDIPSYFVKFGFQSESVFPNEIEEKRKRCINQLDCSIAHVLVFES